MSSSGPDIRDIRAPYLIAADWRIAALAALAGVLLLGLAWWVWRRFKSRHPQLTLLQRTLEQLEATRSLMAAGDARAFAAAVSDVLRAYVEVRFNVRATQRTTSEFLHECLGQVGSALQAHEQALGEFLKFCDLAKFARWSLNGPEMQGMLASARHFVETTAAPIPGQPLIAPESLNVPVR